MGDRHEVKLQQVTFKVVQQVREMQNKKCSEKVCDKHEWQTGEQAKDKDDTEDGTDGETQGTKTSTKNENKRMTQTVKLNHVHPFFYIQS